MLCLLSFGKKGLMRCYYHLCKMLLSFMQNSHLWKHSFAFANFIQYIVNKGHVILALEFIICSSKFYNKFTLILWLSNQ